MMRSIRPMLLALISALVLSMSVAATPWLGAAAYAASAPAGCRSVNPSQTSSTIRFDGIALLDNPCEIQATFNEGVVTIGEFILEK